MGYLLLGRGEQQTARIRTCLPRPAAQEVVNMLLKSPMFPRSPPKAQIPHGRQNRVGLRSFCLNFEPTCMVLASRRL